MRQLAILLVVSLPLAACGGSAPPAGSAGTTGAAAATYFTVPQAQMTHIQVVPVLRATWATTVRTTGTVDWDNDHTSQAITQVSGPITRILVDTGAVVHQGDPLLDVASPDMAGAVSTYRKAINRLDLAKRTLDRDRDLLDHKAIAQRDLETSQADDNDAEADVADARQALQIFGLTDEDLGALDRPTAAAPPALAMRAPVAGTVVEKLVLPGQVIQAGSTVAFVISDVSTVWVQGHLDENDLASVHTGDVVDVRTPAFPDAFHGVVTYIGEAIDPATRTTPVRIVTKNPGGRLKKDLFVDAVVHDKATRAVLSVPTSAVLYDDQNLPFVYAQVRPGAFAQRPVTLGVQQDDRAEIRTGLTDADHVVAEGSVFLQFANSYQR